MASYSHMSLERIVNRLFPETTNSELADLFDSANLVAHQLLTKRYSSAVIEGGFGELSNS